MIEGIAVPFVLIRTNENVKRTKRPYYELFFQKLKTYAKNGKLKKNFEGRDLSNLLRNHIETQEYSKASTVRTFLNFCCQEYIGICEEKYIRLKDGGSYKRYSVITDLAKYKSLQAYLIAKGITNIEIKDKDYSEEACDRKSILKNLQKAQQETPLENNNKPAKSHAALIKDLEYKMNNYGK